ncbi:polysaccharide export protein EpsE [Actimicrobium sp. CCC2.4]|uniref:polysaccharide export protein EpsE n=1 Tax=Actimicrobium sp. CCC2.4 TaxID=3048606 RepID=UPI002AC953A1|nr:polysaccharide export protein EpsE [Actimicrobium sp. CCC2.4]MEB0136023.1 polysaccharide export protein EpsE [Actimicrobium sp. CCC2.4]WPX32686.1 polysaccharide export protein EpsE [Actimicrobium sp. CCC2.4]
MKKIALWLMALTMAFNVNTVVAADVLLGPGDVIKVSVFGNPDLSLETRVSQTGSISFPLIGEVAIGGLAASEAEKKIASMLETGGFLRKPQVNLLVTVLQSQQVSVLGQVTRPGRYPIDGTRTLTDILALAGGVGPDGGDIVTIVRTRDGQTTKEAIDLVEMMRSGDFNKNLELTSNDVVYVERAPRFYIYGEVQRAGFFRLERDMTVLQALSAGGGLSPRGTERGIRIKRRDADGKLSEISAKMDDLLKVDDVVFVKESMF